MSRNQINASVKLSPDLKDRIQALAEARRLSAHALMLQALEIYVEREEKREALRTEARAAHAHYELTGMHLDNDEVLAWLDHAAQGGREKLPPCHT